MNSLKLTLKDAYYVHQAQRLLLRTQRTIFAFTPKVSALSLFFTGLLRSGLSLENEHNVAALIKKLLT